ncbi:hypothetical protein [Polycladidibacter stylochi]|uniref:hypothetical protein n=1 Tax=Polycladidibacter stylochi TaxID=1807766 RepID=UPI00082EB3B6|nr:hypothetical protein [Pseudovibrio stylochi]
MSVYTNSGRATIVEQVQKMIHGHPGSTMIAVGTGQHWWGRKLVETHVFSTQRQIQLAHPPHDLADVTLIVDGDDHPAHPQAYDVRMDGRIMLSPNSAVADGAKVTVKYRAHVPPPPLAVSGLVNEVGRTRIAGLSYLEHIPQGQVPQGDFITVGGIHYQLVDHPTRMLLIRGKLEAGDAVGDDINEFALMTGCKIADDAPKDQIYYDADQVEITGTALAIERRLPVPRDGTLGTDFALILVI